METNTTAGTEFAATELYMQIETLRGMRDAAYDVWHAECVRSMDDEVGTPDRCAELCADHGRIRAWLDAAAAEFAARVGMSVVTFENTYL